VGVYRHFRGVLHEIQMSGYGRACGGVRVEERIGKLRFHVSGNI